MSRGRRQIFALLVSVLAGAQLAGAASLFDPALTFRFLRTEHFRIYFHQGEDQLAARLATIAEETWRAIERPLGVRPPRLTHVVLADQTDLANGYATPLPYDTIVIFPTWPSGAEFNVDDWLRLVFTHEFTHIVHLDRSESWARVVRGIFGRTAVAFPNMFLPTWQIEGLATYQESAMTGEGRLHAGDFQAIVDEAARQRTLEPIDRVNGGLTDWPAGQGAYAYGVGFHQYLVERFGARALADLADATARRVPYTAAPVFRRIFGQSLGELWRSYESSLIETAGPPALDAGITRLTRQGFVSAGPRFDPVSNGIVYAVQTPHGFPSLVRIDTNGGNETRLATRYLGSTTAVGRDALYFDQLEMRRNVALIGDLYERSRGSGRVRQLTSGARVHDPDLSPDGRTLAAVQELTGRRDLVLLPLTHQNAPRTSTSGIVTLVSAPDTQFDTPRWSPDGRQIAVARHRLGADPEIVVVDVATRAVHVLAAAEHTRIVMPTWRPDGRAIVAAVAPDDFPFNLYEFSVDEPLVARQLTHTTGGATWPDVSPDGRTIVFVGYTTDGYDVFSMPYPTDAAITRLPPPAIEPHVNGSATSSDAAAPAVLPASTGYSPFSTLAPTSWEPVIESDGDQVRIGAAVGGVDVLGYHAYGASATWLISSPDGALTPSAATPDWFLSYAYSRWRPTFFATASSETSFFAGPPTASGTPSSATRRAREIEAGLLFPIVHVRSTHAALLSALRSMDDFTLPDRTLSRDRSAVRGAWRTVTAHTYGYSISPEAGIAGGVTTELVRRSLGAFADATTSTADVRVYLPGIGRHHVLAARLAGGTSRGDAIAGRTFLLGGAGPDASVVDFGDGAVSLLRGFPSNSFAGRHVALVNAEYRWPIARPQRGVGTWPMFLHTVHAAAFVDAGHAWTRAFDAADVKTSFGGELSFTLVVGYFAPFTVTTGGAWGHDGSGTRPNGVTAYVRIGRSF